MELYRYMPPTCTGVYMSVLCPKVQSEFDSLQVNQQLLGEYYIVPKVPSQLVIAAHLSGGVRTVRYGAVGGKSGNITQDTHDLRAKPYSHY